MSRVPLAAVLDGYLPGSHDATGWTWDDHEAELDSRACCCCDEPGHYQAMLEDHLRSAGRVEQGVYLGPNGRVWDGHHRIVAARRLGFTDIPLEDGSDVPVGGGS